MEEKSIINPLKFEELYRNFILDRGMFELNIPSGTKNDWRLKMKETASGASRVTLIKRSRLLVFTMLLENYKRELNFHPEGSKSELRTSPILSRMSASSLPPTESETK